MMNLMEGYTAVLGGQSDASQRYIGKGRRRGSLWRFYLETHAVVNTVMDITELLSCTGSRRGLLVRAFGPWHRRVAGFDSPDPVGKMWAG